MTIRPSWTRNNTARSKPHDSTSSRGARSTISATPSTARSLLNPSCTRSSARPRRWAPSSISSRSSSDRSSTDSSAVRASSSPWFSSAHRTTAVAASTASATACAGMSPASQWISPCSRASWIRRDTAVARSGRDAHPGWPSSASAVGAGTPETSAARSVIAIVRRSSHRLRGLGGKSARTGEQVRPIGGSTRRTSRIRLQP